MTVPYTIVFLILDNTNTFGDNRFQKYFFFFGIETENKIKKTSKHVYVNDLVFLIVLYIMFLGSYQNVDVKLNQEMLAGNRFECTGYNYIAM